MCDLTMTTTTPPRPCPSRDGSLTLNRVFGRFTLRRYDTRPIIIIYYHDYNIYRRGFTILLAISWSSRARSTRDNRIRLLSIIINSVVVVIIDVVSRDRQHSNNMYFPGSHLRADDYLGRLKYRFCSTQWKWRMDN